MLLPDHGRRSHDVLSHGVRIRARTGDRGGDERAHVRDCGDEREHELLWDEADALGI